MATSSNAQVADWFFEKIINYTQTTDNLAPTSATGWSVEIAIEMDNETDATGGTISGGGITGTLPLTWEDGEWLFEEAYIDKAALDAEFPSGATYTLTLSGGTLGILTQTVTLPAEVYPNIPYLTGTVFTDLATVDASSNFDLTWGPSGTSTNIFIEITQEDPWMDFVDAELAAAAVIYTIPANTLSTTGTFEGDLFVLNSASAPAIAGGFGVDGGVGHARSLVYDITTVVPGPTPAILSWELEKGEQYVQESDDTAPSSVDFWFFYAQVETENTDDATSVTISGGNLAGSLQLALEGNEWTLEQEYASAALLNATHPDGAIYTLTLIGDDLGTLTQNVTFSALTAPNVPYLTGSDFSRVRSIDAAADFDFHWNDAGSNGYYVEIEFYLNDLSVEPDVAGDLQGTLHATSLDAGFCDTPELFFANEQFVSGSGGFGVDGLILRSRITSFDVFTVLSGQVDAIVGAWQFGDGASDTSGVLLFQADGTYFHAEDVVADGTEVDGMERGSYNWNVNSGLLTATPNTDTNGELGLSAPIGGPFTATVDGNTMTIADTESTTLNRVNDPADAIVGGWRICDNASNDTGILIFLDNGVYFHAEVDPVDGSGMERGTYTWNSGTETLTINSTPVDINNQIGLAGAGSLNASVTGRKVLTIGAFETTQLYRVSNAAVRPEWRLNKSRDFTQTADNTQATVPSVWSIWGLVKLRNPNDATSITLSGEDGSGTAFTVAYAEDEPGEWTLDPNNYADEAALDADYPNGVTFTITLSGGELGTLTQEIQSSGGYPTIPYMTGTVFSDALEMDPTATFEFTWNSHPDASVQIVISSLMDEEGDEYFELTELVSDLTVVTINAGTIPADSTAYGYLDFAKITSTEDGIGGFGSAGFASNHSTLLDVPIATLSTTEVIQDAYADAGLTDPADILPTATPYNDGVENILKYAFNMDLSGPDSSTLENGGNSGLPATGLAEVDGETFWQVEFVRPKGSGLVYTPMKSTTLAAGTFEPMIGAVSTQDLGNGLERVIVSEPCDPKTTPSCFSRVQVALP
jgi:hypothetical protein